VAQIPRPTIRLIGELWLHGADWDLLAYPDLFRRLGAIVEGTGTVTRYVRYYGQAGGRTEVRFFGVDTDTIGYIPAGMIALELGEDTMSVYVPTLVGPAVSWRRQLTWNWLDRSGLGGLVGEFTVSVPADWTSVPNSLPIDFILSANAYFKRGNPADDDVALVEYDPLWRAKFSEMADWLRKTVPQEVLLRVEHYGSTAIPGMPAKPVIDILLEVPSFAQARRILIPAFNKIECEYWWYNDHMSFIFRKGLAGTRTHHIHAAPAGHRVWEGIVFRDYLRAHPDEGDRYATLKRELAERHATDREAYTNSKEGFVREVTAKALRLPHR
jgi:GrpB-like predicted nucleotidyltransferase (UPF0157 family)